MKLLIPLTTLLAMVMVLTGAAAQSGPVYVDHEKVAIALAQGGPLITIPNVKISGAHRDKAGVVELHEKDTDIFYVTDGGGMFVTGGSMVKGAATGSGETRGSDINGGETHQLSKGDVIVIPAGTPHWFKEVPRSISYYLVKVEKARPGGKWSVTYVDHAKVTAALVKPGPLADGPNLKISGGFRTGPSVPENYRPAVEVHDSEADLFYVIDGSATLITGGNVVGREPAGPGQIRGSKIEGGQTNHLTKGDVMWVPGETPHWFPEISKPLKYLLVKVIR